MTVSKSIGMANSECGAGEADKITGTKRLESEFVKRSPRSNSASGHIVYVRRKPEMDSRKSNIFDTQIGSPRSTKSTGQGGDEPTQQPKEENKSETFASDATPLPRVSPLASSSKSPSVFPSPAIHANATPAENAEHLQKNSSNPSSEDLAKVNAVVPWEERYHRLQSLLKALDQSDQHEYVQMLWSLSSVELSRVAVELEKRSMRLSMEEAKEIERAGMLDILGERRKKVVCQASSTHEDQLQK